MTTRSRHLAGLVAVAAFVLCGTGPRAQTQLPPAQVFRSGTELVLVNVVVRDKSGAVVHGLTRDAFAVSKADKPQTITSFDFEDLDTPPAAPQLAPTAPL